MMHDLVSLRYYLQKLYVRSVLLPLAKEQSAQDYVFTMNDYNKILFHAQKQFKVKSYN